MKSSKRPTSPLDTLKPLNPRQERFAQLVASGTPATRAYGEAGYSTKGRNAEACAARLLHENAGVAAKVTSLRAKVSEEGDQAALLTLEQTRAMLKKMAEDEESPTPHRVQALALDAKLGNFAPEKLTIESSPISLATIREIAAEARIVSPLLAVRVDRARRMSNLRSGN